MGKAATIQDVLDAVTALTAVVEAQQGAIDRLTKQIRGGDSSEVPAYDRPSVTADQALADGSVNPDGSMWSMQKAQVDPVSGQMVPLPAPVKRRDIFGYWSPVKTPRIWEIARKVMAAERFQAWDAEWKRNPYAIYRGNPADIEAEGTEVNFLLFGAMSQPVRTYQQD